MTSRAKPSWWLPSDFDFDCPTPKLKKNRTFKVLFVGSDRRQAVQSYWQALGARPEDLKLNTEELVYDYNVDPVKFHLCTFWSLSDKKDDLDTDQLVFEDFLLGYLRLGEAFIRAQSHVRTLGFARHTARKKGRLFDTQKAIKASAVFLTLRDTTTEDQFTSYDFIFEQCKGQSTFRRLHSVVFSAQGVPVCVFLTLSHVWEVCNLNPLAAFAHPALQRVAALVAQKQPAVSIYPLVVPTVAASNPGHTLYRSLLLRPVIEIATQLGLLEEV